MSSESRPEREPEPETGRERDAARPTDDAPAAGAGTAPEAAPEEPRQPGAAAGGPGGDDSAEPAYADRCYRSPAALAGGVLLLLLAAWLGTDALVRGSGRTRLFAVSGLLFAVPLVVAFTFRPAVYANPRRMRVRNPFRTVTVPWGTVESVQSGYSSEVVADGTKYQLWSIPVSLRARKRAARAAERAERGEDQASRPARPTGPFGLGGVPGGGSGKDTRAPSDQAIDELRSLALENSESSAAQGEVAVRWAYEIVVPALAGGVALLLLFGVF